MEALGHFTTVFHYHNRPLSGQQVRQGDAENLVTSLGVGTRDELQAGGLVDAESPHLHMMA